MKKSAVFFKIRRKSEIVLEETVLMKYNVTEAA